jgi:predicted CopG family antitoxin
VELNKGFTTIRVKKETRDKLLELRRGRETLADVVDRLVKLYGGQGAGRAT